MVMIIFGVFVAIFVFISTYFYEEKQYVKEEEQIPFFKAFKATFKNKSFLVYEIISFSLIFVQTALFMGVIYYFNELEVSMLYTFLMLFIGIIVGLGLFIMKHESWGIKKCMTIMLGIFSFSCFLILFTGRFLIPVMIGFLGIGVGFSGGMFLIPLMNGDVIDKDEEMTGLRREGMYAGVNSFITKPAISLAQAAFLMIIATYGYIQGKPKGTQSTMAETGIIIAWMLIPAILLLICFISMKMYPLAGPEWIETKAKLAEIHIQKEKDYLEKLGYKYVE
jgi:GPH family glycoside/pentoside/hexuronide:cation symporter